MQDKCGCKGSKCPGGDVALECEVQGSVELKKYKPNTGVDAYDLADFDARKLRLETSSSSVKVQPTADPYAVVTLTRKGKVVARRSFNLAIEGDDIVPANHAALTSFVRNNYHNADDFEFDISNVEFESEVGSNTLVMELAYDDTILGGDSDAVYIPGGGGFCNGLRCYDPR